MRNKFNAKGPQKRGALNNYYICYCC